jgi:hypothetical protein
MIDDDVLRDAIVKALTDDVFGYWGAAPNMPFLNRVASVAMAAYRAHPNGSEKDWYAGRDAALRVVRDIQNYRLTREDIMADIRALTPPERAK